MDKVQIQTGPFAAVEQWELKGVPLSNLTVRDIVNGLPELRRLDFGLNTWDLVSLQTSILGINTLTVGSRGKSGRS